MKNTHKKPKNLNFNKKNMKKAIDINNDIYDNVRKIMPKNKTIWHFFPTEIIIVKTKNQFFHLNAKLHSLLTRFFVLFRDK